jgi:hypothetical protein
MASIGPQIPGMNATVAPVTVEGQLKEMDMDLPGIIF